MRAILSGLLLATLVLGCGTNSPKPANISLSERATSPSEGDVLTGEVLEHIPAASYSYVRIRTSDGDVWAAVNAASIETGSRVTVTGPLLMKDFESPSLKRTFKEIYFGSLASSDAASAVGGGDPHAGTSGAVAPFDVKVEKASGGDARTVAETWAQASAIDGKTVTVRGKVVKYNEQVMGKNWIHVQDGTGDAAQGTHDLTVTSLDAASIGAIVTITGTVRTNKDFGSGYVYRVIVEDAKVMKR